MNIVFDIRTKKTKNNYQEIILVILLEMNNEIKKINTHVKKFGYRVFSNNCQLFQIEIMLIP